MRRLSQKESGLTKEDYAFLKNLSTPIKIQNYLDSIPMNWEKGGDTHHSPLSVLKEGRAHCIEGAMLAAAALWIAGEPPIILNLSARMGRGDVDHVVALYRRGGRYGAVSKTNHAVIRFRDPVYRTLRELALSYFHEWFMNSTGEKTLECYSKPLDMRRFGVEWITSSKGTWHISDALSTTPHYYLVPKGNWKYVRRADLMEMRAGKLIEWPRSHKGT